MANTLDKLQADWGTLARQPGYWKRGGRAPDGFAGPSGAVRSSGGTRQVVRLTGGSQLHSIA